MDINFTPGCISVTEHTQIFLRKRQRCEMAFLSMSKNQINKISWKSVFFLWREAAHTQTLIYSFSIHSLSQNPFILIVQISYGTAICLESWLRISYVQTPEYQGSLIIFSGALDSRCSSSATLNPYLSLHPLGVLLHAFPNEAGMELLFVISVGVWGLSCIIGK